jgi:transcriptional antiterminator RfaH
MHLPTPAWYSARTKPKHEHIAAANLRKNLGLEVFFPRFRVEKMTRRGVARVVEPLFPCYIFVRCVLEDSMAAIQYSPGISRLVHFGDRIPPVPDPIINELESCFHSDEAITVEHHPEPGDAVTMTEGTFAGMQACVLRNLPAKKRVQVLLDILGRPTPVEVERHAITLNRSILTNLAPLMATPTSREILSA